MFKQFMNEFYHDPNYRSRPVMRLAPLFCKLAFESNFQNNNPDTQKLNRLAFILRLIYIMDEQGKKASGKINIEHTTFDDLNNQFGTIIDELNQQENERMQNAQYEGNTDYEVIGPIDYKTANRYGNQSCSTSKLCYTQSENTWDRYTQDGYNNVYIILKNGWENIPEQHDDESNSAYDTYGLSMIFVFIDGEGELVYCNTRWNHNAKYESGFSCDHAMSKEGISRLIGARFDEVFKPNNKWRELLTQIEERLQNGEDPKNIFDYVDEFYKGFARVKIKSKGFNYITEQGELLWKGDKWFDDVNDFFNGFAKVYIKSKGYNFINTNGELVWDKDKWFDDVNDFSDGFAGVGIYSKGWNFINTQCELLWKGDKWFDDVNDFFNGFAKVEIDDKYNFINTQGKLVWKGDKWFDNAYDFYDEFARVKIEGRGWNFINTNGELLWKGDKWFDFVNDFFNGFVRVEIYNKVYKLNTNGALYDRYGNRVNLPIQESKRRLIRLTESDIHKLVIKTLQEYLY